MATYIILNLAASGIVLGVLALRRALVWNRAVLGALAVLLVMTAIFDSLIIGAGIVQYDTSHISGLRIGLAPIEDFFYSFIAAVLIPGVWNITKKEHSHE